LKERTQDPGKGSTGDTGELQTTIVSPSTYTIASSGEYQNKTCVIPYHRDEMTGLIIKSTIQHEIEKLKAIGIPYQLYFCRNDNDLTGPSIEEPCNLTAGMKLFSTYKKNKTLLIWFEIRTGGITL
jgi:hypothetical protein